MSAKTVMVTGGAGFIGSSLVRRRLAEGHRVVIVDNFSSGRRRNVVDLRGRPDVRVLAHDVCDPLDIDAVDEIYHLACPASPVFYQRDPIQVTRTSVLGTINMLELSRWSGAPIVYSSTSEVYGDPQVHPQTETYWGNVNPVGVRACYDEGKRCAETLCLDYRRRHRVQVKIARIFNTYGPGMRADDGRVISNFIVAALTGRPLTVYGSGDQTRSLCHVDDTVTALTGLMATGRDTTGPVNIGNPAEITVKELADLIIEIVGRPATIEFHPLPSDDPHRRRPDIARARELLGWEPTVDLMAGLVDTIGYFRTALGV